MNEESPIPTPSAQDRNKMLRKIADSGDFMRWMESSFSDDEVEYSEVCGALNLVEAFTLQNAIPLYIQHNMKKGNVLEVLLGFRVLQSFRRDDDNVMFRAKEIHDEYVKGMEVNPFAFFFGDEGSDGFPPNDL